MPLPIAKEKTAGLLRPALGSRFLEQNCLEQETAELLSAFRIGNGDLMRLHEEVKTKILLQVHRQTGGRLRLMMDDGSIRVFSEAQLDSLTDELMGLVFDRIAPSSAGFVKLNEYSLRVQSLSVLRNLHERFKDYYTEEEYAFLERVIRSLFPPEAYRGWLGEK